MNRSRTVRRYSSVSHRVLASLREVCKAHTGTAEARGKAVLRAYYQILKDDPDGARLFVIEIARVGPAVDEVWAALLREFGELLTQAVARDRAAMRASNELVRTGAVGAMVQIAKVWIRSGYARSVDAVASDALRLCRVLAGVGRVRMGLVISLVLESDEGPNFSCDRGWVVFETGLSGACSSCG